MLERLREVLHREPLLVVPTAADVAHYQRELAAGEVVFGAEVLTFSRLWREIGRVAGVSARPLGVVARERVVRAAIRDAHLRVLAPSAAAPGFARAAGALFAELQRSLVEPARFTRALRAWGGVAYADELAALYSAYRRRLEALGRPDRDGEAWAVLDALRADPARVGAAAGVRVRLRRADPRAARRGGDPGAPGRGRRVGDAPVRARAARAGRQRGDGARAGAAGARSSRWTSAPSTTRRRRGRRCTTSSAGCSRAARRRGRRTARCGCSRRAASARRPRSSAPRCSS